MARPAGVVPGRLDDGQRHGGGRATALAHGGVGQRDGDGEHGRRGVARGAVGREQEGWEGLSRWSCRVRAWWGELL